MKLLAFTTIVAVLLAVGSNALSNTYLPPRVAATNSYSTYAAPVTSSLASYAAPSTTHVSIAPASSYHSAPLSGFSSSFGGSGSVSHHHTSIVTAPSVSQVSYAAQASRFHDYPIQRPVPVALYQTSKYSVPAPQTRVHVPLVVAASFQAPIYSAPAPRPVVHAAAPVAAASYSAPSSRVYSAPVAAASYQAHVYSAPAPRPAVHVSPVAASSYSVPSYSASSAPKPVIVASHSYIAPAHYPVAAPSNIQDVIAAAPYNYETKYSSNGGYEYR